VKSQWPENGVAARHRRKRRSLCRDVRGLIGVAWQSASLPKLTARNVAWLVAIFQYMKTMRKWRLAARS